MSDRGEDSAGALIKALDLAPHREGGWYRETWRAEAHAGERAAGTAIYFLLEAHQRSHWHKVDADEHWFWHGGAPLLLSVAGDDGDRPGGTLASGGALGRMGAGQLHGRSRFRIFRLHLGAPRMDARRIAQPVGKVKNLPSMDMLKPIDVARRAR
jgi:hypothetical protein